mgnify:CR=1 FL=1
MSDALMAQQRGIVLHACHCGWGDIWEWAAGLGVNHWRIGQDISDDFNYPGNREKYYFDVLDQQYPGSRFVLTTRDLNAWLESRTGHVERNDTAPARNIGFESPRVPVDRDAHFERLREQADLREGLPSHEHEIGRGPGRGRRPRRRSSG